MRKKEERKKGRKKIAHRNLLSQWIDKHIAQFILRLVEPNAQKIKCQGKNDCWSSSYCTHEHTDWFLHFAFIVFVGFFSRLIVLILRQIFLFSTFHFCSLFLLCSLSIQLIHVYLHYRLWTIRIQSVAGSINIYTYFSAPVNPK